MPKDGGRNDAEAASIAVMIFIMNERTRLLAVCQVMARLGTATIEDSGP